MNEPIINARGLPGVLHRAMEEILGADGARAVLHPEGASVNSCVPVSGLLQSLEAMYGAQPGQGLAQRIGRACFHYGLHDYGDELGFTKTSFRLLPFPTKLKQFANRLGGFLNGSMQQVRIEQADGKLLWHMGECPLCRGRHAAEPVCHLAVGLAEEALYWLSGGKMFGVEEVACVARGDPTCALRVNETPFS